MTQLNFPDDVVTLSIDIGGSGVKGALLDAHGTMISDKQRIETPYPCPPTRLVDTVMELSALLPGFHRVSVGFPGLIRDGRVNFIPSLSKSTLEGEVDPELVEQWAGFHLEHALNTSFGVPVRVVNDADMQGCAAIKGKGLEFVMTLGTGCGTALFFDGRLLPHLELGHSMFRKGQTFEEQIGNAARREIGKERWVSRVLKAIEAFDQSLFYDHIYIGGGNGRYLKDIELAPHVTLVSNTAGILGGIKIWGTDIH